MQSLPKVIVTRGGAENRTSNYCGTYGPAGLSLRFLMAITCGQVAAQPLRMLENARVNGLNCLTNQYGTGSGLVFGGSFASLDPGATVADDGWSCVQTH